VNEHQEARNRSIINDSRYRLAELLDEFSYASGDEREVLLAGIEFERWLQSAFPEPGSSGF